MQLAALPPFPEAHRCGSHVKQCGRSGPYEILQGSADDAEDTASDLAEFDMEDPVGVELNDFVDILNASSLDDDFESVHD